MNDAERPMRVAAVRAGSVLENWWEHAPTIEREREPDICGGVIPAEFKERDFDEAAAFADERLADFRTDR